MRTWGGKIAAGVVTAALSSSMLLISPAWAADDGAKIATLPSSPTVQISGSSGETGEPERDDKADADEEAGGQADQLDEFQHYIDLVDASEDLEDYLANVEYGTSNGTGALILPGLGQPTSEYGPRVHPITGRSGFHTGADLTAGDGTIYAADNGTVVQATTGSVYGNYVILDHGLYNGQRLTTMYAHQADLQVATGDRVAKGEAIGSVGSTGVSTGPHLHFEVRLDGRPVNPAAFLPLTF